MNRFKIEITKQLHDQLSVIDFNEVTISLKAPGCTISLDCEDEKDHHFIIEMEISEENQMNIDKVATQTEHQEEMSALSGEASYKVIVEHVKWNFECAWHAIKAFEDGEKLYTKQSDFDFVLIDNAPDVLRYLYSIYERIERDETPQQREERERLEAAEILHNVAQDAYFANHGGSDGSASWDKAPARVRNMYLAIVDKTNYRKG